MNDTLSSFPEFADQDQRRIQDPRQTSKMKLLQELVNGYKALTIFKQGYISDVRQAPE